MVPLGIWSGFRVRFGWGTGVGSRGRGRGRLVGRLKCGNDFVFEFRFMFKFKFGFEIGIGRYVHEVGSGVAGG